MKPLNYDNSPCSPISSNCVIWQGPDLHCIKLCTGDTVSDVVANLATELCTIMEQLDITNYDLSCFNLVSCPPNTFEALIQFLIEKICSLEGISSDPNSVNKSLTGCPDCLVSVASCFIVNNITSMQLIDYVNMIGQRVCNILTTITELQNQINELDVRVTVLENASTPTFTLPTILVDCTLQSASPGPFIGSGGPATAIDLILSALINDDTYGYCALRTSLGLPAELQNVLSYQCISSVSTSLRFGTPMGTAYSGDWIGTPTTIADTLIDIWISICDIFDYLSATLKNTVVAAGTNITVTNATVGNTTTYTVNSKGLDYYNAQVTIGGSNRNNTVTATINDVANAPGKTVGYGGNNYTSPNQVQDILNYNYTDSNGTIQQTTGTVFVAVPSTSTFVTLNNTTGVFTISKKGEYLLTMSCYLKASSANNAYWKTSGADGRFDIGICSGSTNSRDIFTGSSKSIVANMDSNIILNAQCTTILDVGSEVIFRVLNLSGTSYAGGGYDGADAIRVGLVKLRDL
jgi:hypothetical protein